MARSPNVVWTRSFLWALFTCSASLCAAQASPSVRGVSVLRSGDTVEVEIQTSQRIEPQVQVLTGPDRIVVDFPGALPGPGLHAVSVRSGLVKEVRTGLFETKPPVTRVVFDLKTPQGYQLFPSAKAVIVKVGGASNVASAAPPANPAQPLEQVAASAPAPPPPPPLTVGFKNGMLSVNAERASLAEVLYQIHVQTGAEIAVPSGAEQEKVIATLGPAPARDVLTQLLDGSPYNFIILGTNQDPNALDRVILSPRGSSITEMNAIAPPPPPPQPVSDQESDPPQRMVEPPPAVMPGPGPDANQPDPKTPPPPDPPQN
jgi:AMIN domain